MARVSAVAISLTPLGRTKPGAARDTESDTELLVRGILSAPRLRRDRLLQHLRCAISAGALHVSLDERLLGDLHALHFVVVANE